MTDEMNIVFISALTSIIVSLIVLSFTTKKDSLVKDITRDIKLLEEAYGPLKGYIQRIGTPERLVNEKKVSCLSMKEEIIESIIALRNRFEYEFSDDLKKMIDFILIHSEGPYTFPYKNKIQSLSGNSTLRVERKPKVWLKEFPKDTPNGEEFRKRLNVLVNTRFDEIKNSLSLRLKIEQSIFKLIIWSIIGYRMPFSIKNN